jgi:GntR family transcriptional regulator / MocR family aminotransferase
MRTLYAERQSALVEAASQDLAGLLDVPALEAGLHLVGWLGDAISEAMLLEAASSANVDVTPTSSLAARKPKRASVILGYAPFSPREIRRATKALARACV